MPARPAPASARRRARRSALVAVVALAVTSATGSLAAADGGGGPGGGPGAGAGSGSGAAATARHTVTLITGDVVTLTDLSDGTRTVDVTPADPSAVVETYQVDGDLHVVPAAALPYLASGALDEALFDVTSLVEHGFDDASVDGTPVIVEYSGARTFGTGPAGLELGTPLASIDGAAGTADRARAEETWSRLTSAPSRQAAAGRFAGGVEAIHLDAPVEAYLDSSVPYIGAPQAWEAGYDGTGVRVAVLDSGVDAGHPDLAGAVVETRSFVPGQGVEDVLGHGTHVASTVAGSGAASGGTYRGVAPGVDLLVGKVLADDDTALTSWVIQGMEWGAANADIVSMSLGSTEPSDGTDVMSEALDAIAADTGALFVVAAGNQSARGSIGSPAAAASALAVGSVDDPSGALSWFSSQGPLSGSGALKPEIGGPGSAVTAARSSFSPGDGPYTTMDGTSMATPHVSGAAALALQADPTLTGDELKDLLVSSARDVGLTPYQVGGGVVDAFAAVDRGVYATGVADLGMLPWGESSGPLEREVVFTNRSAADVTLDLELAVDVAGPGGGGGIVPLATPVTLSDPQVTVPAGGTASVTLTGDHAALAAGGELSGALVGSVAGVPVTRTAVGMITEAERYDLGVSATGLDGEPTSMLAMLFNLDTRNADIVEVDGEATLRLPPARYAVMSFAEVETAPGTAAVALVGDPEVVLDGDAEVVLDARAADPVTVDVGRTDLAAEYRRMDFEVDGMGGSALIPVAVDELRAQPLTADSFAFTTRWRLRDPRVTLTLDGTDLRALEQGGTPRLDGDLTAAAVDLGTGRPGDVAGIRLDGKIAVVRSSSQVSPPERAANAAAAGAGLLVVVQPDRAVEWYGDDLGGDAPLPVVAVSGEAGTALLAALAAGAVELDATGRPVADDVYDLLLHTEDGIPANPTKTADDLALVTATYHGTDRALVGEFRYDFAPGVEVGQGALYATERPAVRREWVSTTDAEWYQTATDIGATWEVRDVRRAFAAGAELAVSYFGPVVRPYVGPGYWAPFRQGDMAQINLPGWADGGGADHTGAFDTYAELPGLRQHIELSVDGVPVRAADYQSLVAWDLPLASARWRVVATTAQDGRYLPTSLRTISEWEFDSAGGPGESVLPMMQAAYEVDAAVDGTVGAGRPAGESVPVGIEVAHLRGAAGSAPVASVAVEFSTDDGATWQPVDLAERGAASGIVPMYAFVEEREHVRSFDAAVPVPDEGAAVSLRLTAVDEAGSTFRQEITRAFDAAPAQEPGGSGEPPVTDPPTPPVTDAPTPPAGTDPPAGGSGDGPGQAAAASPAGHGGSLPLTGASLGIALAVASAAIAAGIWLTRLRRRAPGRG